MIYSQCTAMRLAPAQGNGTGTLEDNGSWSPVPVWNKFEHFDMALFFPFGSSFGSVPSVRCEYTTSGGIGSTEECLRTCFFIFTFCNKVRVHGLGKMYTKYGTGTLQKLREFIVLDIQVPQSILLKPG